ncbi:MAG: purine-nucleoside phosphorylase [Oscillospiraceae bacterium]|nr:purine-nucleoside phosphorylase [Oscillospiraceae bacterium]
MATPHINAKDGAFAKCILLPGDPRRAKFIADNFLENAEEVTNVRNILGFTGTYKGRKISVMGTGMGVPSIGIYVNELMMHYGIEVACRIGTCGSKEPIGSVLLAQGCCTNSDMNRLVFPGTYAPVADYELLRTAYEKAKAAGKTVRVGNFLTSDMFYQVAPDPRFALWSQFGVIGTEMEGAALYTIAKKYKKKALVMATVSDGNGKEMTTEERETTLNDMIRLALDTVWEFAE